MSDLRSNARAVTAGGLDRELDAAITTALGRELAKVAADERAAFDGPSRTSARAGRTLYNVHLELAAKARTTGNADQARALIANIGAEVALPSLVLREAARRTVAGAAKEIGAGMARDAAKLAQDTGRGWMGFVRYSPFIVGGLLFVAVSVAAGVAAWRLVPRSTDAAH